MFLNLKMASSHGSWNCFSNTSRPFDRFLHPTFYHHSGHRWMAEKIDENKKGDIGRQKAEVWLFPVQNLESVLFCLLVPSWCITTEWWGRSLSSLVGEHLSYSGSGYGVCGFQSKSVLLYTTVGMVVENQARLLHMVFLNLVSTSNLGVYLWGNFKEKLEGISKLSGSSSLLPS